MSVKMKKIFSREMQNLDAAGLLRIETEVVQTDNMEVCLNNNKSLLSFIGNDYLGWSYNDKVHQAAKDAFSTYATGSTSSRTTIGTLDIVKNLEERIASFLGVDDCIVFSSNYLANISLFEPLTNPRDTIFIDEMCNPGLFDGVRLSNANVITYKHKDYEDLEYHLKCSQNSRFRIVVTDGVFSADGYCANLNRIQYLKEVYDAITIVDDSFGIGVLGVGGKGTFSHLQLEKKAELITGSFAHAFGNVSGGFVCGDKDLVSWIRHMSKSYIYSEPIPPVNAAIVLKVIEILEQEQAVIESDQPDLDKDESVLEEEQPATERLYSKEGEQSALERLYSNSKYIKNEMLHKKWNLKNNDYPFVSINVGSTLNAQKMVEHLFDRNILVSGLCYPNTPEGASLLRINVSANHTEQQIDQLINSIEEAFSLLG